MAARVSFDRPFRAGAAFSATLRLDAEALLAGAFFAGAAFAAAALAGAFFAGAAFAGAFFAGAFAAGAAFFAGAFAAGAAFFAGAFAAGAAFFAGAFAGAFFAAFAGAALEDEVAFITRAFLRYAKRWLRSGRWTASCRAAVDPIGPRRL